ncbi:SLBB domain-containing protein [Flavitalea flava]
MTFINSTFFAWRTLLKRGILLFPLLLFFQVTILAQTGGDLSNVRVEELTDEQIRKFIIESDRLSLKDDQIEQLAFQKGMSPVEVVKLKARVESMRKSLTASNYQSFQPPSRPAGADRQQDSISALEQKPVSDFSSAFAELTTRNFGFDVFNNKRLTFEPNLRIPTPKNYILAADDELLIDVSGYSEANYKLKVSPEGTIRIPVVGLVTVSGQTIEQAKKSITRRLASTVFSDIKTGHTLVEVTLGTIRSIRVTIIGEAALPGVYTLPSLATAYNALYACGGPNQNGSFRNIQVIRNNSLLATIDIYQYLVNGTKKNDIHLMDQDVIRINTYAIRIALKGEVKKPGLYDVAQGETLGQIMRYAGGFTDNAYTARIQVFTNTSKERRVTTITEEDVETVIPRKGDSYIIGKILNRFVNRVSIRGAVYRPGEYELKDGMTLLQLLNEADGIREDAFTSRASLHRLKDDLSPEIVSFDPERLLKGETPDIVLRKEDRINIFSKFDLKEGYYVSIEGEVSAPGIFLYEEGITVRDLVLLSGGLKEAASVKRVEISRRIKDADPLSKNTVTAIIYQEDINLDLRDSSKAGKFVLLPFDEVAIRPAPGYFVQKNAVIEGEIIFTGKYTLETKNDRISDLVKRSGGLTPQAYLAGAVLVRTKNFTKTEQNNNEQGLRNLLKQDFQAGSSPAILQNDLSASMLKRSENVNIDLQKILEHPGSEYDLLLNDGDTLRIPRQLQTVRVNGEVLFPALVRYDKRLDFKDYIIGAGGFSEKSSRKKSYVVYPNGSVKGTRSFLFFKNYPTLSPGAEIFVPVKRERERLRPTEILSIIVSLATLVLLSYNIIHK